MLYTIADMPGSPETTRRIFYRTRPAAFEAASGRAIVAASLWYDATRGVVVSSRRAPRGPSALWTAPAILDRAGCVTILAPVPAFLLRAMAPPAIRIHAGGSIPRPRIARLVAAG